MADARLCLQVQELQLRVAVLQQCLFLQLLYDTFSAFGMVIATPKIMRDPDTGASKGFGFVSFDGFEASDGAIEAMNGQYLCNRSAYGLAASVPQYTLFWSLVYSFLTSAAGVIARHSSDCSSLFVAEPE